MNKTRSVLVFASALALSGCGSDEPAGPDASAELREVVRQAHEFDPLYDAIESIEYSPGQVTVSGVAQDGPQTIAQVYCEWVSDWLYQRDGSDAQVIVNIPGTSGDEVELERRGESESCATAAARTF